MQVYLPIAEIPVDIFLIFGMSLAVGFISGMFGIGDGGPADIETLIPFAAGLAAG